MKEQEALKGKCQVLVRERETWKRTCTKMAKGISPVLDIIGTDFTEAGVEAPKVGLVEKSQKAWGWLQQWAKDIREYVRAHVLSLVCAHYLSWNRPNYRSTSTKTITKVIKFSDLSPYNSGSPMKSRDISNQQTYKPRL
jgi:hypothetical protein